MGQHRDYFKKEMEKVGEVLARIIAGLLGHPSNPTAGKTLENAVKTLKAELDIDLDAFLAMDEGAMIQLLVGKSFSPGNMKSMADILYQLADIAEPGQKTQLRQKALALYRHIMAVDTKTVYFDVPMRLQELEG